MKNRECYDSFDSLDNRCDVSCDRVSDDSVKLYLEEIGSIPKLSSSDEKKFFKMAQQGDEYAKNRLIESNLQLVVHLAKDYINRGVDFLDLIQYGNMGLMRAIDGFDTEKGFAFSSYAGLCIRNAISQFVARNENGFAMSAGLSALIDKYNGKKAEYYTEFGFDPTDKEIAGIMGVSVEQIGKLKKYKRVRNVSRLDAPIENAGDLILLDVVTDNSVCIEDVALRADAHDLVMELFSCLNDKENEVLKLRYGGDSSKPMIFDEVAKICGVSRETVRKHEIRALKKMGEFVINNDRFSSYIPEGYKGFDIFSRKLKK